MAYCPDVPVPATNSANNIRVSDVIGSKSDTHEGSSILGRLKTAVAIMYGALKVYPTLASGVSVAKNTASWTLGSFVEIIPADTIASAFSIVALYWEAASASNTWELVLYAGLADEEVEIARVQRRNGSAPELDIPTSIVTDVQPANTRISARVMASGAVDASVTISLGYVTL